eukprot:gnl/TRDRNA2_/TRDRNA2_187510_c0_seq1.p1 gnl/TRDRNA2_/TRDRNA2_187510_c0~~gnl/TRDRNA2_/TRDRNA2_187510_c0_seq1.p1  ORF type:complete len:190 (-),score=67.10 gnl/TRDRNA2_/TRDRNA2_187510_c0_seq1:96-665(-)
MSGSLRFLLAAVMVAAVISEDTCVEDGTCTTVPQASSGEALLQVNRQLASAKRAELVIEDAAADKDTSGEATSAEARLEQLKQKKQAMVEDLQSRLSNAWELTAQLEERGTLGEKDAAELAQLQNSLIEYDQQMATMLDEEDKDDGEDDGEEDDEDEADGAEEDDAEDEAEGELDRMPIEDSDADEEDN